MKNINSRNLSTERLDLKLPTMEEQYRLWEILCDDEVNSLYFPTPNKIFEKYNLKKYNINDLKKAREIFLDKLKNWDIQKQYYESKIQNVLEQGNQKFTWSIFLKGTNTVIGQVTCQEKDGFPDDIRDVGWYIDPLYQGKGYATEAATSMLDFMFNEVEITEVQTSAADYNKDSWKIMEKLGFNYVGNYVSTYYKDNQILECKKYYGNKELFNNRNNKQSSR